jgi:hypothetical protein
MHGKMLERKCVILEWGHVGKEACGRKVQTKVQLQ